MTETTPAPAAFVSDETTERFLLNWGLWATLKICAAPDVKTVLDIGSGAGEHARLMRHFGKEVFTNDWKTGCDYPGAITDIDFEGKQFDAVLCSHVIEHQRNVGQFLDKLVSLVKDGGLIAIAAPSHTQFGFVVGHLSVWSMPLLAYNLVQSGVDCGQAQGLQDNESTLVVRKKMIDFSQIKEASWNETNLVSGQGLDGDTTVPWHDDLRYIRLYMPHDQNGYLTTKSVSINWGDSFLFPLPESQKDIGIMTRKQAQPITLQYEAIKARHAA